MKLEDLGWNPRFAAHFAEYESTDLLPARISFESKGAYRVITPGTEMHAVCTGRLLYQSDSRQDLPVVGDWVAARIMDENPPQAVINAVLPRKSVFYRKEAGTRVDAQPIAANVDIVFITVGLDGNFSLRRIERYLALAWDSGASPVVLLTKSDLCSDLEEKLMLVEKSACGAPIVALSVLQSEGLAQMDEYLVTGHTVALLGSSGVGKSTIINYLLGSDAQKVNKVRDADSKGLHTTTSRQLFILPSGAQVIDTPGMRELQLWNADGGVSETFADIEELASRCRFEDCRHESEPGCEVIHALEDGEIDPKRMENYRKMRKELDYLHRRQDQSAIIAEKTKWKSIHKELRHFKKG